MLSKANLTELETQIGELEIHLAALKEKRNRMAVWMCNDHFPLELFVKIIKHLQIQLEEDYNIRLWGNVIRVCRRFRDISIQSPELWSTFQMHHFHTHEDYYTTMSSLGEMPFSPKWLDMCDKYGKDRITLNVVHGVKDKYTPSVTLPQSALDWLTARTRVLTLDALNDGLEYEKGSLPLLLLQRSWSVLEDAELYGCHNARTWTGNINTRLLGGSCSSLTKLSLTGSWMLENFPTMLNLQHLQIDELIIYNRRTELRTFLSSSIHLASLDIGLRAHQYDREEGMQEMEDVTPIILPHLDSVTLCGETAQVFRVLDMLPDPCNTLRIFDHGYSTRSDPGWWSRLSARIVAYLDSSESNLATLSKCIIHLRIPNSKKEAKIEVELRTKSADASKPSRGPLNSVVKFTSYCEPEELYPFFRFTDHVIFEDMSLFADIVATLETMSAFDGIRHLTIIEGEISDTEHLSLLESFLRARKDRGNPLTSLEFQSASLSDIQTRWVEEGLLTRTNTRN
jgi:hypothetical protein